MLRKKMKTLLSTLVLLLGATAFQASAQIDAQFTQYWAVPSYYNPSSIGNVDFIHITGGSKLQWIGVKHAPMNFLAMADMPFKFLNRRWGAGLLLQQENVGLFSTQTISAQLAWKKKMLGGMLSVGVQVGLLNQTFKGDSIIMPENDDYHTSADDAIPKGVVNGKALDVAAGVMFGFCTWSPTTPMTRRSNNGSARRTMLSWPMVKGLKVPTNTPVFSFMGAKVRISG